MVLFKDRLAIFSKGLTKKRYVSSLEIQILIKITQCHYLVLISLQNGTTDFDETLHVAWICLPEKSKTTGTSGYSPV